MAPPVPQTEPQILVAGDTWAWTKTLASYPPAESWLLGYAIRGQSVLANADVVVTSGAGNYSVAVAKTKTLPLVAGAYQWQSFVDKVSTGEHYTVDQGVFTIVPSMSAVTDNSAVTHAERMLLLIEARLEGRLVAGGDNESYSVAARSVAKIPVEKLLRMRAIYQAKVFRLKNQGQLGPVIVAQMNNPDGTIGTSEPVVLPPWYRALTS